jgi:FKBP-type peptidyl-prolyl cis-trans isomerase
MSVTAVPLRPIAKGSVAKLWVGLAALSLAAVGLAWAGTSGQQMTTTASGLQLQAIEEGTGPSPTTTDIVLVHYTGRLEDGTVFDTSEGKQPVPFPVTGVIPGFTEGLQMMKKGGTYRLRIPPELAYGPQGAGGVIPPNATLEFDIQLLDIAPQSALQGMMGPPQGGGR